MENKQPAITRIFNALGSSAEMKETTEKLLSSAASYACDLNDGNGKFADFSDTCVLYALLTGEERNESEKAVDTHKKLQPVLEVLKHYVYSDARGEKIKYMFGTGSEREILEQDDVDALLTALLNGLKERGFPLNPSHSEAVAENITAKSRRESGPQAPLIAATVEKNSAIRAHMSDALAGLAALYVLPILESANVAVNVAGHSEKILKLFMNTPSDEARAVLEKMVREAVKVCTETYGKEPGISAIREALADFRATEKPALGFFTRLFGTQKPSVMPRSVTLAIDAIARQTAESLLQSGDVFAGLEQEFAARQLPRMNAGIFEEAAQKMASQAAGHISAKQDGLGAA